MESKYIYVFFEKQTDRKIATRHITEFERDEIKKIIDSCSTCISFPMENGQFGTVYTDSIFASICTDINQIGEGKSAVTEENKESALS